MKRGVVRGYRFATRLLGAPQHAFARETIAGDRCGRCARLGGARCGKADTGGVQSLFRRAVVYWFRGATHFMSPT